MHTLAYPISPPYPASEPGGSVSSSLSHSNDAIGGQKSFAGIFSRRARRSIVSGGMRVSAGRFGSSTKRSASIQRYENLSGPSGPSAMSRMCRTLAPYSRALAMNSPRVGNPGSGTGKRAYAGATDRSERRTSAAGVLRDRPCTVTTIGSVVAIGAPSSHIFQYRRGASGIPLNGSRPFSRATAI